MLLPAAFLVAVGACTTQSPSEPPLIQPPAELAIVLLPARMEPGEVLSFRAELRNAALHTPVYRWDFGDGSVSENAADTVSHIFPAAGTYTVILRLTDTRAALHLRDTLTLTLSAPAEVAFKLRVLTPKPFQALPTAFQIVESGPLPASRSYRWDFGDGSAPIINNSRDMEHIYDTKGAFIVRATLLDNALQSIVAEDSAEVLVVDAWYEIEIHPDTARISPGDEVTLRAEVLGGPLPGDKTYSWNFGNGSTLSLRSPDDFSTVSRRFHRVGVFPVVVRLESNYIPGTILARDTAWVIAQ